jgi:hypothetical protein
MEVGTFQPTARVLINSRAAAADGKQQTGDIAIAASLALCSGAARAGGRGQMSDIFVVSQSFFYM